MPSRASPATSSRLQITSSARSRPCPRVLPSRTRLSRALVEGVTMTEREVRERARPPTACVVSFRRARTFNPHQHQAMMEMQNVDVPPGTILEVFQPGYLIEDRVLRPAMVVVAKGGQRGRSLTRSRLTRRRRATAAPPNDGPA